LFNAIDNMPETGRVTGVLPNRARLYLAKAYLTYGWWLENPNNIPTNPNGRVDLMDKMHLPFQQAYDIAVTAMTIGAFRSAETFYDVNLVRTIVIMKYYTTRPHRNKRNIITRQLTYGSGIAPDN
jgi:hypothetical protein